RGANLAPSAVESAVRLRPARDLPDTIVRHQGQRAIDIMPVPGREKFFDKIVVVVGHVSLLRSGVRIHPPAADESVHGGSDRSRLLDDHEMPGARDIDDLHSLT